MPPWTYNAFAFACLFSYLARSPPFLPSCYGLMRCSVCGWPDGPCPKKRRQATFFYVYLGKKFLKSMTIPCFMRGQIHNMVGKVMLVKSPKREEYLFELKKKHNKTCLFGAGYMKLLADYDMKEGDRFRIELDHPAPFFAIFPEESVGVPKQRVIEPHVFEGAATAVVFSKGLELTAGQTARMNVCVLTRGLGLGAVFVHTITCTDVLHNGLRIPKEIVSVINIPETGNAFLMTEEDGNNMEASYYTCKDGRLCFKSGWSSFAEENELLLGDDVLILFHKNNDGCLIITFDVL